MKENGPLAFLAETFEIDTCQGSRKLFKDLTLWEMSNLKAKTILDIPERLYGEYHISPGFLDSMMKEYGIQSTGKEKLEKEFGIGPMSYFVQILVITLGQKLEASIAFVIATNKLIMVSRTQLLLVLAPIPLSE